MELSILVAKMVALYYLAIGAGILSKELDYKKVLKSFQSSPGLMLISGFLLIVLGVLLLQHHNIWVKDWTVLITLIGWAITIKGVLLVAFPKFVFSIPTSFFTKNQDTLGVITVLLGALFAYFGFFM